MKVLYVTSVYPRWQGDATPPFVQNQAELMADKGYTIRVLAPHSKGAAFEEGDATLSVRRFVYMFPLGLQQLCYDGGMLIRLKANRWTAMLLPFFFFAQIYRVFLECWRWCPDVIHSHSLLPQGLVCSLAARVFQIPHVCTSHGNDIFGLKSDGFMGALKRQVLKEVELVTANSTATKEKLLSIGAKEEKVSIIPAVANETSPDPALVEDLRNRYGHSRKILFVGRMIEEKGILELLSAFTEIHLEKPDLQCFFVGDGVLKNQLEARVKELELESVVHFLGWRPREEVPSWMAFADVLVVPSKELNGWQEAQGLVVVEAMAVGTVVVASNVGGIPDMIIDQKTGYLFEHEQPGELVRVLKTIIQKGVLDDLSQEQKALYSSKYSRAAISVALTELYHELGARSKSYDVHS